MRPVTRHTLWLVSIVLVFAGAAAAQPLEQQWRHGTTVAATVGVATDSSDSGALAGMALGWQMKPALSIEANATWLDRGKAADAFTAALKAAVGLTRTRPAVPFLSAGFGLYRFSVRPGASQVPAFYHGRMAGHVGMVPGQSFTDPACTLGTGVNIYVSRHIAIRPDVEGIFVFANSRTHAVTTTGVHVVYRFEDHPVTP